jgi:hypothetical protein
MNLREQGRMSTLRNAFLEEDGFFDGEGFGALADQYGIDAVLRTAARILRNGDWREVRHTLHFLAKLTRGNDLGSADHSWLMPSGSLAG